MFILDPTRRRILSNLAERGSMNIRKLSESIGFYLSPTQYQISKLQEEGLIQLKRGKWGSKNCSLTLSSVVLLVASDVGEHIVEKLALNWQHLVAPIFSFWPYFKKQGVASPAYRILEDSCREIVKQYADLLTSKELEDAILLRLVEEFYALSSIRGGESILPGYDAWLKAVEENPSTYAIAKLMTAFVYLKKQREAERTYNYLYELMTAKGEHELVDTQLEEVKELLDESDVPALLFKIREYLE